MLHMTNTQTILKLLFINSCVKLLRYMYLHNFFSVNYCILVKDEINCTKLKFQHFHKVIFLCLNWNSVINMVLIFKVIVLCLYKHTICSFIIVLCVCVCLVWISFANKFKMWKRMSYFLMTLWNNIVVCTYIY